ncbi:hypothetical protein ABZ682_27405 [Streptomyces griseoviridis]|nr:hypothetical protein [Streptomyces sp. MAA16]MDH6699552.1 hypothetical protein [Streptomyces sp. MAA16]
MSTRRADREREWEAADQSADGVGDSGQTAGREQETADRSAGGMPWHR